MSDWYYIRSGKQYGPVPESSIRAWLESGFLDAEALLWTDGMEDWTAIAEIPVFVGGPTAVGRPLEENGEDLLRRLMMEGQPDAPHLKAISYAGFWWRALAFAIDWFIWGLLLTVVWFPKFKGQDQIPTPEEIMSDRPYVLLSLTLQWLYFAFFEASSWQGTPGKRLFRIRVTDLNGGRLGFGRATLRHVGKLVTMAGFYIGFLFAAFTRRKQALHDLLANCVVVRD